MTDTLHYRSIAEIAPLLQNCSLSPVEVTRRQLERIKQIDGSIRSYATVMAESAMAQAKVAEQEISAGHYRGPLHGVPIAVKDLCATRGVRTMGGCAVFADNVPDFDATVVTRLQEAGAILLGKLNLTEGAMGGYNPALAYPENPWGENRFPGASSSGSGAATAAGLAFGTLGSDTGGSIRYPAAACGTVGLKPTWGRVSRFGVMDLAASLDHVGPLTRSTRDAAFMLQAIAGHDLADPTSLVDRVPDFNLDRPSLEGVQLGFDPTYASADLAEGYATAVSEHVSLLASLGATIREVRMPESLREYLEAWPVLCSSEAAFAHRDTFPAQADSYGPWFRQWLERGNAYSAADYAAAFQQRLACNGAISKTFEGIDALVFPGSAQVAHPVTPGSMWGPIPAGRDSWHSRFTVPFDYNGYPTLSLPAGLSEEGLPYSLQLAANPLQEALLIQLGTAFEGATAFHTQHPPGWP